MLIKNTLHYEPFPFIIDDESAWCKLFLTVMTLVIGVIYRPRPSPVECLQKIDEHLCTVKNNGSRIILVGGFNLPSVDWDARVPGPIERPYADLMLEIMTKHGLIQAVKKSTQTRENYSSLLYSIFLSDEALDHKIDIQDEIWDYNSVLATINVSKKCATKQKAKIFYDFNAADDTSVIHYLACAFNAIPQDDSGENLWQHFVFTVGHCLKKFVPLKKTALTKRKSVEY